MSSSCMKQGHDNLNPKNGTRRSIYIAILSNLIFQIYFPILLFCYWKIYYCIRLFENAFKKFAFWYVIYWYKFKKKKQKNTSTILG